MEMDSTLPTTSRVPVGTRAGLRLVSCVCLVLVLGLLGCELGGIEGDEANYISFVGVGPDGEPLGFAGNTIPMVDSTVLIRVLVADTVLSNRAGQGLPVGAGRANVVWTVTDGVVAPEVSEVGEFGIAETRWTLGTEVGRQTIMARIEGEGAPAGSVSFSLSSQNSRSGLFPGPPVELVFRSELLDMQEGGSDTLELVVLRDKYGNAWNLDLFDFSLQSLDTTIVRNASPGNLVGERVVLRGSGGGQTEVQFRAVGVLTSDYDFRSLSIAAQVPVVVRAFQGFSAVFEMISAGSDFACGVVGAGTPAVPGSVHCWGAADGGRLGGEMAGSPVDAPRLNQGVIGLPAAGGVRAIASGASHSCVLYGSNEVYCWGSNTSRQLGSFATAPGAHRALTDNPNAATFSETGFVDIEAGLAHTCVVGESGSVYCWGNNAQGQLGNGTSGASQVLAQRIQGLDGIRIVSLAETGSEASHTCAVSDEGALYCWGEGTSGQLGDGFLLSRSQATRIAGGITVQAAVTAANQASNSAFTCAISMDGQLYCWGRPPEKAGVVATPELVDAGSGVRFVAVDAGPRHVCLVSVDEEAYCFGTAESGRLGTGESGSNIRYGTPQRLGDDRVYTRVVAGERFSLALQENGEVFSWGANEVGQLGQATDALESASPARVVFPTSGPS